MFDASVQQGRGDTGGCDGVTRLFQIVQSAGTTMLSDVPAPPGFACDTSVVRNHSRAGAVQGPREIRRALVSVPAHGLSALTDADDAICSDGDLGRVQTTLTERVCELLGAGARSVLLGGGHKAAFGIYQGLRQHQQGQGRDGRLAVVNLGVHFNLHTSHPGNSGISSNQVAGGCTAHSVDLTYCCLGVSHLLNTPALFDRADALHTYCVEGIGMQERHLDVRMIDLNAWPADTDHVCLTIDMDVLVTAVTPNVSTPTTYGITFPVLEALVQYVCVTGKVRVVDTTETNPEYDQDHRIVRITACLMYHLLHHS